jgi:hypothetical protein
MSVSKKMMTEMREDERPTEDEEYNFNRVAMPGDGGNTHDRFEHNW